MDSVVAAGKNIHSVSQEKKYKMTRPYELDWRKRQMSMGKSPTRRARFILACKIKKLFKKKTRLKKKLRDDKSTK